MIEAKATATGPTWARAGLVVGGSDEQGLARNSGPKARSSRAGWPTAASGAPQSRVRPKTGRSGAWQPIAWTRRGPAVIKMTPISGATRISLRLTSAGKRTEATLEQMSSRRWIATRPMDSTWTFMN